LLKPQASRADVLFVRASLTMTLISVVVVMILTVLGARACTASSPSSPSSPLNVARNGLAGLCANQQATAQAGGADAADSGGTIVSPEFRQQLQGSDPNGLRALQQAAGGSLACPTTTVPLP
jgi:hypothetical protein